MFCNVQCVKHRRLRMFFDAKKHLILRYMFYQNENTSIGLAGNLWNHRESPCKAVEHTEMTSE